MYKTARKDTRIALQIPIDVSVGKRHEKLLSEDISFNGVFIRTDNSPPIRSFIKMKFPRTLFPQDFMLSAMVVHNVPPRNRLGRSPGFGVELYANSTAAEAIWNQFVTKVAPGNNTPKIRDLWNSDRHQSERRAHSPTRHAISCHATGTLQAPTRAGGGVYKRHLPRRNVHQD
ncbi:MAG: PilZ domain-containing protein [Myxococcota bacterium]